MLINELTRQASLEVLARTHFGRLACCRQLQPYIVPFHFDYQNNGLYSFSMPGQKIDWMRANPLVCVEADQIERDQWTTVIVFGHYTELPETNETRSERATALALLQQRAEWWEPGCVKIAQAGIPPEVGSIFYRISVGQISGRRTTLEPSAPATTQATAHSAKKHWLHALLRRDRR